MSEEILNVPTEPVLEAKTDAPVSEPSDWVGNTEAFRNGAPEKVSQLFEAKKWNNAEQLVDAYMELEKFKGVGEHLVIPEAEDAEGWQNVYNQLGRPETADKYDLQIEGGAELSDELVGSFKEYAHGLGLTQKQFNDIVSFQIDAVSAQEGAYAEQTQAQIEQNVATLKQKYGVSYDAKITSAKQIADNLGIYETIESKGLASDPEIIDMLATIASKTSEDVITPQTPTPAEKSPQEELNEIRDSEAFKNKFDRNHKQTMARFMELNHVIANSGLSKAPSSR